MTTVQLARELHSTTPTVSAAMREVKGVVRDNVKDSERRIGGSFSACVLWTMR